MNKSRRQRIEAVINTLEEMMAELQEIKDEEDEAYNNLPESLMYSDKGSTMEEYIDSMESCCSDIENVVLSLGEITR